MTAVAVRSIDISVVVPVRNGQEHIGSLCTALAAQTLEPDRYEVIIIDDASTDATADAIDAWVCRHARWMLLRGQGRGPGHARNIGIAHARGDWVAFTDSDTMPDPQWLETALAIARRTGADVLEGAIEPWPPRAARPYAHRPANATGGRYMTANMIYRRELLEQLGGFDERFEQFLEDSDLAFRAMDAGREIPFVPELRVRHRVIERSAFEVLRSTRRLRFVPLLAAKHPDRYRTQLRPIVRPLSSVDIDALLGLALLAAVPSTRGPARIVAAAGGLRGVRNALGSGETFAAPRSELLRRASLSLALPIARAWWWAEGCVRYRKLAW